MENYNYIVDITTGERHSIFSETGRTLLKSYIQTYKSGGSFFDKIGKGVKNLFGKSNTTSIIKPAKPVDNSIAMSVIPSGVSYEKTDDDVENELANLIGKDVKLVCKSNVTDKTNNILYPIACRDETKEESLKSDEGEYYFNCINDSCKIIKEGDYLELPEDVESTKITDRSPEGETPYSPAIIQVRGENVKTGPVIKKMKQLVEKNIPLPPSGDSPVPISVLNTRKWQQFKYTTEEGKNIQSILIKIVDNKEDKKTVSIETQNEIFKNLEALLGNPEGKARDDIELVLRTQKLNPSFFNKLKDVVNKDDYPKSFAFFNDETPTSSAF